MGIIEDAEAEERAYHEFVGHTARGDYASAYATFQKTPDLIGFMKFNEAFNYFIDIRSRLGPQESGEFLNKLEATVLSFRGLDDISEGLHEATRRFGPTQQ